MNHQTITVPECRSGQGCDGVYYKLNDKQGVKVFWTLKGLKRSWTAWKKYGRKAHGLFAECYALVKTTDGHFGILMEHIDGETCMGLEGDGELSHSNFYDIQLYVYKLLQDRELYWPDDHGNNIMVTNDGYIRCVDIHSLQFDKREVKNHVTW